MKPILPHDPLDDLIAAALFGALTPEERVQFESRLQNDPAARAAYQEAQLMHDLLEKTHRSAQPDTAFEQRMVSGVRRKLEHEQRPRETAWESVRVLYRAVTGFLRRREWWQYGSVMGLFCVVAVSIFIAMGSQVKSVFTTISSQLAQAQTNGDYYAANDALARQQAAMQAQVDAANASQDQSGLVLNGGTVSGAGGLTQATSDAQLARLDKIEARLKDRLNTDPNNQSAAKALAHIETLKARRDAEFADEGRSVAVDKKWNEPISADAPALAMGSQQTDAREKKEEITNNLAARLPDVASTVAHWHSNGNIISSDEDLKDQLTASAKAPVATAAMNAVPSAPVTADASAISSSPTPATPAAPAPAIDTRKLIRNAQLDLEVKSYQAAMDQITALTKTAGGYVDTSNSQKGGNGKLQGTVVVKILPQNLDDFLFKLRALGDLANQSVSTDDVTKDYYDTQARLVNSSKMEEQLQDLLKRTNGKVSELLQVERELGRVRGEIEQMQGQLKLYDFQVQYATVTIQMREKDLNQAAAYLLKEQDDFSLFATDVEDTFKKARQAADDSKAQILTANLDHNSGTDVSAELEVMVAPDQIEPFLGQIRALGRVANFTRQTQRVAKDGGDSDQPADQTLTEKDKVQVHLSIRSDDETRKQVALTVVTSAVDDALDQAKTATLANAGAEILNSSLNKTPEGQSTAQLSVRVPGKSYHTVLDAFKALGRTASFSLQRDDDSGPDSNGDEAPVIISLSLTDDETPLQQTDLAVQASDVDNQAQQLKKDAAAVGVEIKASSFQRQPDGTELAQMTFRLPISKYPAFIESLKKLGKVESLTVQRNDQPNQALIDDSAPAEITLQMHNQGEIVPDNSGLWATLRETFGEGAGALFCSVRVIGVVIAFLIPWIITLGVIAWVGRRIYLWRKK